MKKKKKRLINRKLNQTKKQSSSKYKNKRKKFKRIRSNHNKRKKKRSKKIKKPIRKSLKKSAKKKYSTKNQKTRVVVLSLLKLNEKIKSLVRFNFNLDKSLQSFFTGISKKISEIKNVIIEERQKQKRLKIKEM